MMQLQSALAARCEATWNTCYPDRRKWADIGEDARLEWLRVIGYFDGLPAEVQTAQAVAPATPLFAVDGPWREIAKVLEYPQAKTVAEVIDHARWLVESYHAMCSRLQEQVQKHKLGLGGEKIDILVCNALDSALSAN